MLRTRQFAEDAGPLSHPVRPDSYIEINNFYTLTIYEKGAEVVRMIHTLLGAESFRKGTDLYFQRHDGQAVTCDDFVCAMEDANRVDLKQFRLWYSQAGTPTLHVQEQYDPHHQQLHLTLSQSCAATPGQKTKWPLHIPVRVGLIDNSGEALPLKLSTSAQTKNEVIIELTENQQTFTFEQIPEKPVVSLLRSFSAPVKLKMSRSLEELAFLLRHDHDTFNRWEAGQQLASKIILGLVADQQNNRDMHVDAILVEAFNHLLHQSWDDLSYFALLLSLPAESYLAEQMSVVDVNAIHSAREQVKLKLAENLEQQFKELYRDNHQEESGQFDANSIGRRRIKNTCLTYLTKLENDTVYDLSVQQYKTAQNMTDQIAALSCIINSSHPEKANCLDSFYQQWQNEDLVIDKWFTLQATSYMPDTFAVVKTLLQHPAFDLNNPNRTRSLVGAFSQSNPLNFHLSNGQGYQFLADQVIALNLINPQVAARMLSAITQWRRFDTARQELMKCQLERIIGTADISPDVYEVASKSLA
jgi:aminopeptidase N